MIPAGATERSESIDIFNAGVPKYFWLTNFGKTPTDYIEWTVSSPASNEYTGWIHIETSTSSLYSIEVMQGGSTTSSTFATSGEGWEKAELILKLPAHLQNKNLVIYHYDTVTNKYTLVSSKHWIDSNNFVHIDIQKGGSYAVVAA